MKITRYFIETFTRCNRNYITWCYLIFNLINRREFDEFQSSFLNVYNFNIMNGGHCIIRRVWESRSNYGKMRCWVGHLWMMRKIHICQLHTFLGLCVEFYHSQFQLLQFWIQRLVFNSRVADVTIVNIFIFQSITNQLISWNECNNSFWSTSVKRTLRICC